MLLFALHLIGHAEVLQQAGAQVACKKMADGVFAPFLVGLVMNSMGVEVTIPGINIEAIQAGKDLEGIRQRGAGMLAETGIESIHQSEAAGAVQRGKEVGVVRAEMRSQGGEPLEEATPGGQRQKAAGNTNVQPAGVGQLGAVAEVRAGGEQGQSGSKKVIAEGVWSGCGRLYNNHKKRNIKTSQGQVRRGRRSEINSREHVREGADR